MPGSPRNPLKPEALRLRAEGKTYTEIGALLSVNPKSVAGWVGMAKRRVLAKEAREALQSGNSALLSPSPPKEPYQVSQSANISADTKFSTTETELRSKALAILAEAETKHISKRRREWADNVLKVTKAGKSTKDGDTQGNSAYSTMGNEELAERGIASLCAILGGPRVDAIIARLKAEGQFDL